MFGFRLPGVCTCLPILFLVVARQLCKSICSKQVLWKFAIVSFRLSFSIQHMLIFFFLERQAFMCFTVLLSVVVINKAHVAGKQKGDTIVGHLVFCTQHSMESVVWKGSDFLLCLLYAA